MKILKLFFKASCFITFILLFSTTSYAQVNIQPLTDAELAEQTRQQQANQQQANQQQTQQQLTRQQLEQQQLEAELRRSIGQTSSTTTSGISNAQVPNQVLQNTQEQPIRQILLVPTTPVPQVMPQVVPQPTPVQPTINNTPVGTTTNTTVNSALLSKSQQTAHIQSLKNSLVPSSWPPNLSSTWQVQLMLDSYTPIKTNITADIYDIEIDAPQEVIDQLHRQGHKVICYLNAGTAESFRPSTQTVFDGDLSGDSELLELWRRRGVLGNVYGERFGNEWWMNPNHNFVRNYMKALLNKCKNKGFDGVSFDNLDGFSFDKWNPEPEQTGFNISEAEQLDYNLWLVEEAHKRGLYAGLKNTGELAEPLSRVYDWVFVESCYSERIQGWDPACENYAKYFATKGKAIYLNEYDWNMQNLADKKNISLTELRKQYCTWAAEDGIFLMFRVDDTKADRLLCSEL